MLGLRPAIALLCSAYFVAGQSLQQLPNVNYLGVGYDSILGKLVRAFVCPVPVLSPPSAPKTMTGNPQNMDDELSFRERVFEVLAAVNASNTCQMTFNNQAHTSDNKWIKPDGTSTKMFPGTCDVRYDSSSLWCFQSAIFLLKAISSRRVCTSGSLDSD